MRFHVLLCSSLLFLFSSSGVFAAKHATEIGSASTSFDNDTALRISQDAIGNQIGDHQFTNASGERVTMAGLLGKPLVLSMVYTSCHHVCPTTVRHLSKIVEKARDTLGNDSFSVAVIGFDTQVDTPEAMQYFADKQGIDDKGWNLFSAAPEDVEQLSKEIGFVYYPSSSGFDHIVQATIVDAGGVVFRQVYGQMFDTPLLVDPLIDLVLGNPQPAQSFLTGLGDKIKLFCTTYDPVRDGYYFDYSLFLGMLIGISIISYTGFIVVREYRKNQKIA